MKTVLLHTCCAPCSLSCIDPLRREGIEPVAFWYNPNIHPWKEYQARRDCLLEYAPTIGMEVRVLEDYGLLRPPAGGHGKIRRGPRLCRLHHHPALQPLPGP